MTFFTNTSAGALKDRHVYSDKKDVRTTHKVSTVHSLRWVK